MNLESRVEGGPPFLTRVGRAILLLELELWSLTMVAGVFFSSRTREELLSRNDWPSSERNVLLVAWGVVALAGLALARAVWKKGGEATLVRWVRLGLPVIPLSWLP